MIPIQSSMEGREMEYAAFRQLVQQHEFALGGNWDYDHGYFDRYLEEAHKVWLRIPFEVTRGHLDSEKENTEALIRIGQPFVLKHIYNEGLDAEAVPRTYGALVDQFQDPLDSDAKVERHWVERASELVRKLENELFL